MSRDAYGAPNLSGQAPGVSGNRSPRTAGSRRLAGELPTVDCSPSRQFPGGGRRGAPRSGNASPVLLDHGGYSTGGYATGTGGYYRDEDVGSPTMMMDERGRGMGAGGHHRSRSASRPAMGSGGGPARYQSLDRAGDVHDRDFMPIRDRERSLERGLRDRSLERGVYEDELYRPGARASPLPRAADGTTYINELQQQNSDLQRELGTFKKELELTNQKLGSSMHSIKTFWSPELKKERALRKEESAKYSLINDQLKLLNSENQKQAMLVRQLEEELRIRARNPSAELTQQVELLYAENEHLTREIAILRETIKELELRIETQKQTLAARDESIKKLLEMLQNKGVGKEEERQMFQQMQALAQKQLEEFRAEVQRRDQEILAMSAKMKTLEEQHTDYQRHIAVLKESLCAKEEHYNMLQADVEELRQRLEEKNRHIEKKTLTATQAQQDRNRLSNELNELRDHMDIKDRKINVLQRKIDLQEANKKAAAGSARAGEEAAALRQQVEEQKRQLEEQRRRLEEASRGADGRSRQLEERERALADAETKLKRRKEKIDQQEAQLQKMAAAGGGAGGGDVGAVQARLAEVQAELDKAKEDAQHSQVETERLLRLVQMSQEEQNQKEKAIRDLQENLKQTQAKLRSQQQANAQMREEVKRMPRRSGDGDGASDGGDGSASDSTQEDEDEQGGNNTSSSIGGDDGSGEDDGEQTPSRSKRNSSNNNNSEVQALREDLTATRRHAEELQAEVDALEAALHEQAGLEELVSVVRLKDDRIAELEEALRESVRIMAERERALQHEEGRRRQVADKVGTLEQRLASLQTSHAMRCSSCRPLLARSQDLEKRLARLLAERSAHLQELASMKQEALEAAISEKDAHLALLEVSGLRTARQAEQAERLRADRRRLTERLRRETEQSVQLLQQYAPPELLSRPSPPPSPRWDAAAPATTPVRPNGLPPPHTPAEVEPDSPAAAAATASSSETTTPSM